MHGDGSSSLCSQPLRCAECAQEKKEQKKREKEMVYTAPMISVSSWADCDDDDDDFMTETPEVTQVRTRPCPLTRPRT